MVLGCQTQELLKSAPLQRATWPLCTGLRRRGVPRDPDPRPMAPCFGGELGPELHPGSQLVPVSGKLIERTGSSRVEEFPGAPSGGRDRHAHRPRGHPSLGFRRRPVSSHHTAFPLQTRRVAGGCSVGPVCVASERPLPEAPGLPPEAPARRPPRPGSPPAPAPFTCSTYTRCGGSRKPWLTRVLKCGRGCALPQRKLLVLGI